MSGSNNQSQSQYTVNARDLLAMERTKLAMERTKLANDRTLLAYIRTSLSFFAAAAALIEFFNKSQKLQITAYTAISIGVVLLIFGVYNYYRSKREMKAMELVK
ncbi:putative membrane protein [Mesobacillus persicus]|uniref:Putative membrane protein n=1 Tax=Mesobacillus persicus TaxID=930146 RepID=A0A1H8GI90_9BACI|nr:DUF202 domain-containing protein [Mesobacillus persicus]SEN43693.1 putative membrane protein [Mesobacillus persicus]